jgi:hypothetical protein
MLMDLVNVVGWRRPDFLTATLMRLTVADIPGAHYRISLDHKPDPMAVNAAREFADRMGKHRVDLVRRGPCDDQGPTRNMLMALHESLPYNADFVHMIEDDIFVSADYFRYHHSAHELAPDAFCVTACKPDLDTPPGEYHQVTTRALAPTVATSYRSGRLKEILDWLPVEYLDNRVEYIRRVFPNHPCAPHLWSGIDGAMGRVRHRTNKLTVFPEVGRAYHAGFISDGCADGACNHNSTKDGYNNGPHRHGPSLTGTIRDRANQLLAMKAEDFNALAGIRDHVWFDLDISYGDVTEIVPWTG